jgi:cation transport ATPase
VARHVSRQVGIREEDCFSRMLPSDKLAWVQDKQNPQRHKKGSTSGGLGAYSGLSSSEDAVRDIELAEPFIFANASTDSDQNIPVAIPKAQRVLMVGDGINDSTALTAASVGVAMGAGGSAMAVNSADVVLMSDNLQLLPASIKLCQMARRTIVEGFVFAIVVKIVAIVLAILGRMAFWQAIIIDIGSLVVVVINGTKPLYTAGLFRQQKRV